MKEVKNPTIINQAAYVVDAETGAMTYESADGEGAAKVKCNLRFPPPRLKKDKKDAYDRCVKEEAAKIDAKRDERKEEKQEKKEERKEKREERKSEGKGIFRKAAGVFKKAALAAPRNAFLVVLKLNGFGMASKMDSARTKDKARWDRIMKKWKSFGGNPDALAKEVERGKGKKPIMAKKSKAGADGSAVYVVEDQAGNSWNYPTGVEEITAALAVAAPLIIAIKELLKGGPGGDVTMDPETENGLMQDASNSGVAPLTEEEQKQVEEAEKQERMIWWAVGILGGIAVIGGIIYFARKK